MDKIKIRLNTFETNSSSAHTFIIRDMDDYIYDADIEDYVKSVEEEIPEGYIPTTSFFGDSDYGRGFSMLETWFDKMSYLVAMFKYDSEKIREIVEVIRERTGAKGIVIKDTEYEYREDYDDEDPKNSSTPYYDDFYDDFAAFGSIDHQSTDVGNQFLQACKNDNDLKDLTFKQLIFEVIFCGRFVIITDSDETDTFMNMYEQGFFKDAGFKKVLYDNYQYDSKSGEGHYEPILMDIDAYMTRYDKEEE